MISNNIITTNCGNDFYDSFFNKVCNELESGNSVKIYIDCIGHTRNNNVQEIYKEKLIQKYEKKLEIECEEGGYSYSYIYSLCK